MKTKEYLLLLNSSVVVAVLLIMMIVAELLFPGARYESITQYVNDYRQDSLIPSTVSLLLTIAHLIFIAALYRFAKKNVRTFALIGMLFGTVASALLAITYFTQIGFVNQHIIAGDPEMIKNYILANTASFIAGIEALGFGFFFIAVFFFGFLFKRTTVGKVIRYLLFVTGIVGFLGAVGYPFQNEPVASGIIAAAIPYLIALLLMIYKFYQLNSGIITGYYEDEIKDEEQM